MDALNEKKLIMVVAQAPFTTPDLNQFCKLVPIIWDDGTAAPDSEFPNDGEIWWMLTAQTAWLAVPGRLVVGRVEFAVRHNAQDPASSQFQVVRDSVEALSQGTGCEIIRLSSTAVEAIEDVVSSGFHLDLPGPPAHTVMLMWRTNLYGPFTATPVNSGMPSYGSRCSLAPSDVTGMTVFKIEEAAFKRAKADGFFESAQQVTLSSNRRADGYNIIQVRHELLLLRGFERILAGDGVEKLLLEPLDQKLQRCSRNFLTRGKRQQLRQLLEELELTGSNTKDSADLIEALGKVKQLGEKHSSALDSMAEALLKSGFLGEDRIASAEQAFAELHLQKRTAELEAKAEGAIVAKRDELRKVESSLKTIQSQLLREESQGRARLEQRLAAEEKRARDALEREKSEFDAKKLELERQEGLLQKNLEKVTKDLREAGDEVVNRFLTIAPLLGAASSLTGSTGNEARPITAQVDLANSHEEFVIPAFVTAPADHEQELSEELFFDRFRQVVDNSGFTFRLLDLQRFHLSVKCGELTVLGGPSGTGKSSLPALYAQALLGDSAGEERPGCLMVNVNPSWMDTRDLLGHLNTLDGRFYPAESGLFQHLVYAQEEYSFRGQESGPYLTCLDEMNLAQVEYYFSDFMMVLERAGPARKIRCFSRESAGKHCQFRAWSEVMLSPALRFIGTVNFDETTRLLSDRFLDRVNLLRLTPGGLPGIAEGGTSLAKANGRMATLSDFQSWVIEAALPSGLGAILDQMRPLLQQMGCPISPRVYRSICRFVSSSTPLLTTERAFDVQVAQRLIPRIRSLITNQQVEGMDKLLTLLKGSNVSPFEESIPLLEEIRESVSRRQWDLEA